MLFVVVAIIVFFGPLLLLAVCMIAFHFEWPIADRILDILAGALIAQFVIGALVNIAFGCAALGLAGWTVANLDSSWRYICAAVIAILGLWRTARGVIILWGGYDEWRAR